MTDCRPVGERVAYARLILWKWYALTQQYREHTMNQEDSPGVLGRQSALLEDATLRGLAERSQCRRCNVREPFYGSVCRACYERLSEHLCSPKVLEVIHDG